MRSVFRLLFIGILVLFVRISSCFAQSDSIKSPVALYVELGGNAVLYSVNFDYSFILSGNDQMALRLGYSKSNNYNDNGMNVTAYPLELTRLIHLANNQNYIEIGPGLTFLTNREDNYRKENIRYFSFRAGYRYQKRDGGVVFRAGILRMHDYYTSNPDPHVTYDTWTTVFGLSLGAAL